MVEFPTRRVVLLTHAHVFFAYPPMGYLPQEPLSPTALACYAAGYVAWEKGIMGTTKNCRLGCQRLLLGLVILAIVAAACAAERSASRGSTERASPSGATEGGSSVNELTTIQSLEDVFNRDVGKARLVLLLSPT
jgi:hypothetical protein